MCTPIPTGWSGAFRLYSRSMASQSPRWQRSLPRAQPARPRPAKSATSGAVDNTITLNFAGGADDIPTFSLADLRACVEKGDKDFFRRHFEGKVVLIGTLLDVEDRKITSKRFATAPEGARAERCALTAPAREQTLARESISGVYVQATAVNNLLRGDALIEFGRIGTGIASFALAALAVAAALVLGPAGAALAFLGIAATWIAAATVAFRDALALPLVEPLATALAALGATIGYRLVVADRLMAAEIAQRRAREAEMASAAAIQRAMLPSMQPDDVTNSQLDIFARMIPAREVGGDLYDIVKLDENRVIITIGDVCGKGSSGLAIYGDHTNGHAAGGPFKPRSGGRGCIGQQPAGRQQSRNDVHDAILRRV